MPVISTFFGIIIRMYYQEHEPARFHAEHRGEQATFTFAGQLLTGAIKSRGARREIEAWALLHRRELASNWALMKAGRPLERIEPLQ